MNDKNRTGSPNLLPQPCLAAHYPPSEEALLWLLSSLPVGCILFDDDSRFKYWNPAAEYILGYSLDNVVGKFPFELIVPHGMATPFDQCLRHAREGYQKMLDMENVTGEGQYIFCKWHFTLLKMKQPTVLAIVQDISKEKLAEEKLQRQLERLRALRVIDSAISGSVDIQVTLNVILQQAMAHLKMDAVDILIYEPSTSLLKFAAGRGMRANARQFTPLRIGQGYAGAAALQKRLIQIPDLQQPPQDIPDAPPFYSEGFQSYYGVPLVAKGVIKGVMESFHRTLFKPDADWLNFFETLGEQAAIAIDNAMLFHEMQRANMELMRAYDSTLEGWSKALDMRDQGTEGHTRRVTEMTDRLAVEFDLGENERVHIRRGAILHDIGKMAIPDSILLKEGPLSEEEWDIMRKHPSLAKDMLSSIAYLRPALDIPYCHHEKWDGTGYPRGLRGEQIPLAARIFAVVDVFDALTSDRPYRPAWSVQKALEYIQSEAGKHFDPKVVETFMRAIGRLAAQGWR